MANVVIGVYVRSPGGTGRDAVWDVIALGTPEAAAQIVVEYNEWLFSPLEYKLGVDTLARADARMTSAVNNYAAEQTESNKRTLIDELLSVEPMYVGQYWGAPELVQ